MDKPVTTLSRRDEFAIRMACAMWTGSRMIENDLGEKPDSLSDWAKTAVLYADILIRKLDGGNGQ